MSRRSRAKPGSYGFYFFSFGARHQGKTISETGSKKFTQILRAISLPPAAMDDNGHNAREKKEKIQTK